MSLIAVLIIVVLLGSFMCSLMEASLYSISRARIETLRRQGSAQGQILWKLREKIDEPIAAILILNTMLNAAGSAVAGALVAHHYGNAALGFFSAGLTMAILFFAEVVPKSLGFKFADRLSTSLALPLRALIWTIYPVVKLCLLLTKVFWKRSRIAVTEDDIISTALMSLRSGSIHPQEAEWITNALRLDQVKARELMTPAVVVRRVAADMPLKMTKTDADHWRFSRIPVYAPGAPDQIIGVVQRRNVFKNLAEDKDEMLMKEIMDPAIYVPESMAAPELLGLFIKHRKHLFCVENGGRWTGIITLEDVLESLIGKEIVGEQDLFVDMQEAARQVERAQTLTKDLQRGGGIIEHVTIREPSEIIGKKIRDSGLPQRAMIGPIERNGTVIVPHSDARLELGDKITLIGAREDVEEAKRKLDPAGAGCEESEKK